MQRHGKSLFADNRQALAAAHYQNRLVDREIGLLLVPQGLRDVRRRHGEAERASPRLGSLRRRRAEEDRALQARTRTRTASTATTTRAASSRGRPTSPILSALYAGHDVLPLVPPRRARHGQGRRRRLLAGPMSDDQLDRKDSARGGRGGLGLAVQLGGGVPLDAGDVRRVGGARPAAGDCWGACLFLRAVWRNMRDKGAL